MTGRSLRTLTNSAGGALALTGGGSGGRAGGGGGGGGGGGDASVTYSDRSVSSWGGGAQQEPTNQSREQLWSWIGRRGESQLHGDTHTQDEGFSSTRLVKRLQCGVRVPTPHLIRSIATCERLISRSPSRPSDKQQQSHSKLLTSDTVWAPWGSGWTRVGVWGRRGKGEGEKSEK